MIENSNYGASKKPSDENEIIETNKSSRDFISIDLDTKNNLCLPSKHFSEIISKKIVKEYVTSEKTEKLKKSLIIYKKKQLDTFWNSAKNTNVFQILSISFISFNKS